MTKSIKVSQDGARPTLPRRNGRAFRVGDLGAPHPRLGIRRMGLCGIVWDMGENGRAYAENYNSISNSMLF